MANFAYMSDVANEPLVFFRISVVGWFHRFRKFGLFDVWRDAKLNNIMIVINIPVRQN